MRRIAQEVGKNDVVIDLGAHVGNATVEFAQTAKHVYVGAMYKQSFEWP